MSSKAALVKAAPAGLVVLLGAFVLIHSGLEFPPPAQANDPGTAALPRLVGVGLCGLGTIELVRGRAGEELPSTLDARRVGLMILALLLYALVFPYVGFIEGAAVFLLVSLFIGGVRSRLTLVGIPVVGSVGVWYIFTLLQISLPAGAVEELIR